MSKSTILISKAKDFATANYENGYDRFVECYETKAWHEFVTDEHGQLMSWSEVKQRMQELVSIWQERESDCGGW